MIVEPLKLYYGLGFQMMGAKSFGTEEADQRVKNLRSLPWVADVFNPGENDREHGFNPNGMKGTHEEMLAAGFSRTEALRQDFEWINLYSQGMVVDDSWRQSPGAFAEMAYHQGLYLPVWGYTQFLSTGGDPVKLEAVKLPVLREICAAAL
jgi:hypothetical protein